LQGTNVVIKAWQVCAAAACAGLLFAGSSPAASAKVYASLGRYGGNADTKMHGNTADITAAGAGTSSYIGAARSPAPEGRTHPRRPASRLSVSAR
jgi:hypothetical protein